MSKHAKQLVLFNPIISKIMKKQAESERLSYSQYIERAVVEKLSRDNALSTAKAKAIGYHSLTAKDQCTEEDDTSLID